MHFFLNYVLPAAVGFGLVILFISGQKLWRNRWKFDPKVSTQLSSDKGTLFIIKDVTGEPRTQSRAANLAHRLLGSYHNF